MRPPPAARASAGAGTPARARPSRDPADACCLLGARLNQRGAQSRAALLELCAGVTEAAVSGVVIYYLKVEL